MFAWHDDVIDTLRRHGWLDELRRVLEGRGTKVNLHTTFSGMGCPEQPLAMLSCAAGVGGGACKFFRSCDVAPACQRVLQSYDGAARVSTDLLALLPGNLLCEVQNLIDRTGHDVEAREVELSQVSKEVRDAVLSHVRNIYVDCCVRQCHAEAAGRLRLERGDEGALLQPPSRKRHMLMLGSARASSDQW